MNFFITGEYIRHQKPVRKFIFAALWTALTVILVITTVNEPPGSGRSALTFATILIGIITTLYVLYVLDPYIFPQKRNGMYQLEPYFTQDEVNQEIAHLHFQESVAGSGIYQAGSWFAFYGTAGKQFTLIPQGIIRKLSYTVEIKNDDSDSIGHKYNAYTLLFFLTNGNIFSFTVPPAYTGKPRTINIDPVQTEQRFSALSSGLSLYFGNRWTDNPSEQLLFLYQTKKPALTAAFEQDRSRRPAADCFNYFREFLPNDLSCMAMPNQPPIIDETKATRRKVFGWVLLILSYLLHLLASAFPGYTAHTVVHIIGFILRIVISAAMAMLYISEIVQIQKIRSEVARRSAADTGWTQGAEYWMVVRHGGSIARRIVGLVIWSLFLIFTVQLFITQAGTFDI